MGAHDDFLFWVVTQKVRWEQVAGELRLTHTGCNIDNHPFLFTVYDVLEYSG